MDISTLQRTDEASNRFAIANQHAALEISNLQLPETIKIRAGETITVANSATFRVLFHNHLTLRE